VAQPVGVNTISKLMPNLTIQASLSQKYTNHSIRATSISIMDESGIEARHIMRVSGHRSVHIICSQCHFIYFCYRNITIFLVYKMYLLDNFLNILCCSILSGAKGQFDLTPGA
jgi:hypothetical protein